VNIIVPIKQVPDTQDVRMDPETGTMIRSGSGAIVNPLDLYAVEAALELRRRHGGRVTAVTMGPPPAERALRDAIALGCDDALLVSDRRFGGSDTWATSYTVAEAIRTVGAFDLVITGERATDGDTGQVGPGIAAWLDLPLGTFVSRIGPVANHRITVERMTEEGYQMVELALPALLTVVKEIVSPGLPTLAGKRRARAADIPRLSAADLNLNEGSIGLAGSPTRVVRIDTPRVGREGTVVHTADSGDVTVVVDALMSFLAERELLP